MRDVADRIVKSRGKIGRISAMDIPTPSKKVPVFDGSECRRCISRSTHVVENKDGLLTRAVYQRLDQVVETARFDFEILVLSLYRDHGRSIWLRGPGTFRGLRDAYCTDWTMAVALRNEVSLWILNREVFS
jgi:hypothetical protein